MQILIEELLNAVDSGNYEKVLEIMEEIDKL